MKTTSTDDVHIKCPICGVSFNSDEEKIRCLVAEMVIQASAKTSCCFSEYGKLTKLNSSINFFLVKMHILSRMTYKQSVTNGDLLHLRYITTIFISGCTAEGTTDQLVLHEVSCPSSLVRCDSVFFQCDQVVPLRQYINHVKWNHQFST